MGQHQPSQLSQPCPPESAITDDGLIFPLERHAMRDEGAIQARMMRDIRALGLPHAGEDFSRMKQLGWSTNQCRAHFIAARNAAHADTAARLGAEAFALLAFLAGILALCSHFAVPAAV